MLKYYEPRLNLASPEGLNIMGIVVSLREPVDGEILRAVVEELRVRFPYFYVKPAYRGDDLVTVPNELPMTVRGTWEPIRLNSEESNFHLAAWKYEGRRLAFEIPHDLTDGAGLFPYVKSALFLYLSRAAGRTFDPSGFRLPGEEIPESETGDPFRDLDVKAVKAPFYQRKLIPDVFHVSGGGAHEKRVFCLKLPEEDVMQYCRAQDASPNVLFSVFLAKAARRYDPDNEKPVTIFVAVDHKAILGNHDNYRLFVGNNLLEFPKSMDLNDISRTCTMARGQLMLQAQPENSLWEIKELMRMLPPPSLEIPLGSFSISYPRNTSFGPLDPYIEEVYVLTTLKPITDILLELTCLNHSFFLAFMQPFSATKFFDCYLEQLRLAGLKYELLHSEPLRMCTVQGMKKPAARRGCMK